MAPASGAVGVASVGVPFVCTGAAPMGTPAALRGSAPPPCGGVVRPKKVPMLSSHKSGMLAQWPVPQAN